MGARLDKIQSDSIMKECSMMLRFLTACVGQLPSKRPAWIDIALFHGLWTENYRESSINLDIAEYKYKSSSFMVTEGRNSFIDLTTKWLRIDKIQRIANPIQELFFVFNFVPTICFVTFYETRRGNIFVRHRPFCLILRSMDKTKVTLRLWTKIFVIGTILSSKVETRGRLTVCRPRGPVNEEKEKTPCSYRTR